MEIGKVQPTELPISYKRYGNTQVLFLQYIIWKMIRYFVIIVSSCYVIVLLNMLLLCRQHYNYAYLHVLHVTEN